MMGIHPSLWRTHLLSPHRFPIKHKTAGGKVLRNKMRTAAQEVSDDCYKNKGTPVRFAHCTSAQRSCQVLQQGCTFKVMSWWFWSVLRPPANRFSLIARPKPSFFHCPWVLGPLSYQHHQEHEQRWWGFTYLCISWSAFQKERQYCMLSHLSGRCQVTDLHSLSKTLMWCLFNLWLTALWTIITLIWSPSKSLTWRRWTRGNSKRKRWRTWSNKTFWWKSRAGNLTGSQIILLSSGF